MPRSPRSAGRFRRWVLVPRWLVVLAAVAVVGGSASSGGAEVDPNGPAEPAIWATSCVSPGTTELVVYGRGWVAGPVTVEVTDQAGATAGVATATAADRSGGAAFQGRVRLTLPATALTLHVAAQQPGRLAAHDLVVSPSCSPSIAAAISATPCASAGRPVTVAVTGRGAPTSIYFALVHHVDLYGPAELVDRSQPGRTVGDYILSLSVPNVPDRLVPVTVEARRADGSYAYATTSVMLPPACGATTSVPTTPVPTRPGPTTTVAPGPTPAPPTSAGPTPSVLPSPFQPGLQASGAMSVTISPTLGRAGEATTVTGTGFAPSQPVNLRWRPGIGSWTVVAGGDGSFRTQVLVLPNDVDGPRVLEVVGGGVSPTSYLVVPSSEQPAFGGVFIRS